MRYYKKILVWENNRRIEQLVEFRNLVVEYFNNSRAEWTTDERIEEEPARVARVKINRMMDEVHEIVLYSGINPSVTWSPPPAVGGYVRSIDLVQNIFNLHDFQIGAGRFSISLKDQSTFTSETIVHRSFERSAYYFTSAGRLRRFLSYHFLLWRSSDSIDKKPKPPLLAGLSKACCI